MLAMHEFNLVECRRAPDVAVRVGGINLSRAGAVAQVLLIYSFNQYIFTQAGAGFTDATSIPLACSIVGEANPNETTKM
jgi:hypothetical protein